MHINEISGQIVDSAIKVNGSLGPGLLESVYEVILAYELKNRGLHVQSQIPVPIIYDSLRFGEGYRLDLLIDESVVIEIKSIDEIMPIHKKQLLTYLRLMQKPLGLLLSFNVNLMKDGITRLVNGLEE